MNKNLTGQPKQYTDGFVEFFKLKFAVNSNVLIPRPETELLVEEVLATIKNYRSKNKDKEVLVLDIGTGAGNIAIAICKNDPSVKVIATDISASALNVAKKNASLHSVERRIQFYQSNLLENSSILDNKYKILIVVTNLPYIPSARIPYLEPSVKDFEPKLALDGGEDGFELYRKLFTQLATKKVKFKLLVGEIDYTHQELAVDEAYRYFPKALIETKKDLAHLQRILKIQLD